MPVAPYQHTLSLDKIAIRSEARQRKDLGDLTELKKSLSTIGLLHPIIITRERVLIAGERRYTAMLQLRNEWKGAGPNPYASIPFRYFDSLDETELQICELEENAKRKDMSWQETALSMLKIANLLRSRDGDEFTQASLAEHVGMSDSAITIYLTVGEELVKKNEAVSKATGLMAAYNVVRRGLERAVDDATASFMRDMTATREDPGDGAVGEPNVTTVAHTENRTHGTDTGPIADATLGCPSPIQCASFLSFAPAYSGEPFNFLHCDFPYGINYQDAKGQGTATDRGRYEDSPDTYWELLRCLRDNVDKIVAPSAHILFWLSMNWFSETKAFFEAIPGFEVNPFPLIWIRNKSLLPSPDYGPRRSYEAALLISRGRRKIIRTVPNFVQYNAEGKLIHVSEKPPAMLRHFFQMLVDDSSTVLDPTCGSGASLRAALEFKPKAMLGLEIDPSYAKQAQAAFEMATLVE